MPRVVSSERRRSYGRSNGRSCYRSSLKAKLLGHHPRAHRAGRILGELDGSPLHRERVQDQQAPVQGLSGSRKELESLRRLDRADDPGERRKHAHDRAAHFLELRVLREEALIAGAELVPQVENAYLPVEAHRRPRDERLAVPHACAIDGVAGGEIVRAVEKDAARGGKGGELPPLQPRLEGG